jgi:hypothetical protein
MRLRPSEGYLIVDHSASPGITPDELHAVGLDPTLAVPEGRRLEAATNTCAHCGTVVIKNPFRIRPRGNCRKCNRFICDKPECNFECTPLDKTFDYLQEQAFRKEAGYNLLAPPSFSINPALKG